MGFPGAQGPQGQTGPAGPITTGSVVMLPSIGGVAPVAPAGYSLRGFSLVYPKANGGGSPMSFAVYTKN